MPWAVAGAGISAAAGLAGSAMQSSATGKAAGQATHNLQMELPQFQNLYNTTNQLYQPYANVGGPAVGAESDLLGLNGQDAASAAMANFQQSPGYQWQLGQGLRAVDAGAASRGMLRSGATLKAEQAYGSGLADQEFGNYFTRLGTLANTGFQGVGGMVGAGNSLANEMTGNVASQNAATIGGANAQSSIYGNATGGLQSSINGLFNNKSFTDWAGGLFGGGGTFAPSTTGTYGGQSVYTAPTNTGAPTSYNF